MTSESPPLGARPPQPGEVCIGTWNVSHWSPAKATLMATSVGASVLAVQETHLAPLPLEWAHTTTRSLGLHLHHGRPALPMAGSPHGRSCGVGFLAARGIALTAVLPSGTSWRMLHAMRRLHAVQLPPRPGIPRGLLLLTVYAPLQDRQHSSARSQFAEALLAVTHSLDMQVPTLLLGDFNGSLIPDRDCRGAHSRQPCPLLSHLLGPGGAWIDVHAALLQPPLPWTFHSLGESQSGASRIDLVLANHSAMALVQSASVLSDIRDGGHSPVLVTLRLPSDLPLVWQRPQPKLPLLLCQPSSVLQHSAAWTHLVDRWLSSPPAQLALSPQCPHSADSLGQALTQALQHLVTLAGGWSTRPSIRRPAYDSDAVRQLRRRLELLHRLQRLIQTALDSAEPRAGSWPRPWCVVLQRLQRLGVNFSASSANRLQSDVRHTTGSCRSELDALLRQMRHERRVRWKATLPDAWREQPAVIYHWLHVRSGVLLPF